MKCCKKNQFQINDYMPFTKPKESNFSINEQKSNQITVIIKKKYLVQEITG